MKQLSPIYHCSQCKKVISSIEDLLFVEDGSTRGFCHENCINNYFAKHISWFEECEDRIRSECGVKRSDEKHSFDLLSEPKYVDNTLKAPDEIWKVGNHLKEEFYVFISHFGSSDKERSSVIVICTVFNFTPSFVFLVTMTSREEILDAFRSGDEIADKGPFLHSLKKQLQGGAEEEWEQIIAAKKSSLLAELLSIRADADIPLESFHLYNGYLEDTLKEPDEVFRYQDKDGDTLYLYIKSYHEGGVSFYYITICIDITGGDGGDNTNETINLIPVISFPTLDSKAYQHYTSRERLRGVTKN